MSPLSHVRRLLLAFFAVVLLGIMTHPTAVAVDNDALAETETDLDEVEDQQSENCLTPRCALGVCEDGCRPSSRIARLRLPSVHVPPLFRPPIA